MPNTLISGRYTKRSGSELYQVPFDSLVNGEYTIKISNNFDVDLMRISFSCSCQKFLDLDFTNVFIVYSDIVNDYVGTCVDVYKYETAFDYVYDNPLEPENGTIFMFETRSKFSNSYKFIFKNLSGENIKTPDYTGNIYIYIEYFQV